MRLYEIRCVISHEISRCHSASMTTGLCSGSSHRDVMQSSVAMVYANARRNTSDQVNADALRAAASAGSVEEVRRVLALNPGCVDLRELGGVRRTALMNAANRGHVEVCRMLLDQGADINLGDFHGWTALYLAAMHGASDDLIQLLLERQADPSIKSFIGWNALMASAYHGHVHVVCKLLPHKGQDVNDVGESGETALWRACFDGRAQVVRVLLLQGGADPSIGDRQGQTPLQIAQEEGHDECVQLIQWFEQEVERAYVLHRARAVREDGERRKQYPRAPLPVYVSGRGARDLPTVALLSLGTQGEETAGTGGAQDEEGGAQQEAQGLEETLAEQGVQEERAATVSFVIDDLPTELFHELMHGLRLGDAR